MVLCYSSPNGLNTRCKMETQHHTSFLHTTQFCLKSLTGPSEGYNLNHLFFSRSKVFICQFSHLRYKSNGIITKWKDF